MIKFLALSPPYAEDDLTKIRTASRHEGPLHAAADAHVPKFTVAVRYAFAIARKALPATVRSTADAVPALTALKAALADVLPAQLAKVLTAGGEASVKTLRTAEYDETKHPRDEKGRWSTGVGFESDPWDRYPAAPDTRAYSDVEAKRARADLKRNGRLNSDGTVTLYHATLSEPTSIKEHGLIPAFESAPGQDWQASHSAYATYFHQDRDPAERDVESGGSVVEVRIPITSKTLGRFIPDEDTSDNIFQGVETLTTGRGAVAFIGGVPASAIQSIKIFRATSEIVSLRVVNRDGTLAVHKAAGDVEGHEFHGNQWTGEIVYHGTTSDIIDKVLKEGLRPGAEVSEHGIAGGHRLAFATTDFKSAEVYAVHNARERSLNPVIFEIHIPSVDAAALREKSGRWEKIIVSEGFKPEWIKAVHTLDDMGKMQRRALEASNDVVVYAVVLVSEEPRTLAGPLTFSFDAKRPNVTKWVRKRSAELVTGITQTTREYIAEAIAAGLDGELTNQELHNAVRDVIGDETRADTIARTETMRAVNAGQQQTWDQAVEDGLLTGDERQVWIATDDELTCPICADLDGQDVAFGDEFGDGIDAPPAHPRCRCTIGLQL